MDQGINLLDLTIEELENLLVSMGREKFRAKQVFDWLGRGVKSIDDMTNLSKDLRSSLKEVSYIAKLTVRAKLASRIDGTIKYLFELQDGNVIESVLMEYKHGFTVCLSSQVGCRMGCSFCASTGAGFARNLTAGEMLDQIISIHTDTGKRIGNIVIMGIGEPLDNYENTVKFLRLLHSSSFNISYRRMTISTCGLVPEIMRLSKEDLPINLSISLHAPSDEIREKIMPVNKKYSIDKIIEACKIYTEVTGRRLTFEYAMISGLNDSEASALQLAHRVKGMLCHVNLIPVNPVSGTGFKHSARARIAAFKEILERYGIETTVRRELGSDISAACGQLRRSKVDDTAES